MVMDGKFTLGSCVVGIMYIYIDLQWILTAPFLKMNFIGLDGVLNA